MRLIFTIAFLLFGNVIIHAQNIAVSVDNIKPSEFDFRSHFFDIRIANNTASTVLLPVEQFNHQPSTFMQNWFCCSGIGIDNLDVDLISLVNENMGTVTVNYIGNADSLRMDEIYHDSICNNINAGIPKQIYHSTSCYKILPHKVIVLRIKSQFSYSDLQRVKNIEHKYTEKMNMMFVLPVNYYLKNKLNTATLISEPDAKIKKYFLNHK